MIGVLVGGYRLLTSLGEGPTGEVWTATHEPTGRAAIVKLLAAAAVADRRALGKLWADTRAAAELRHPNVAQVWAIAEAPVPELARAGRSGSTVFIVSEPPGGTTLGARPRGRRRMEPPDAVRIVVDASVGLGVAHNGGLVHGDVKPSNLLLARGRAQTGGASAAPRERGFVVKLLDFGCMHLLAARRRHPVDAGVHRVEDWGYLAPEQCAPGGVVTARSDVYALGAVAYELLTGRLPLDADSFEAYARAHARGWTALPPHQVVPRVPRAVAEVVLRALAPRPEDRYATMAELRAALEQALAVQPTPSVPEPLRVAPERSGDASVRKQSRRLGRRLREIVERRVASERLRLPALPGTAVRALERARGPGRSAAAIAEVVEEDPLLACRVWQLANAGGAAPVRTISAAVARVGVSGIEALLDELAREQLPVSQDAGICEAFRTVWAHSVAVAQIARELAARLGSPVPPDEAYVAGLLHDVGRPVLATLLLEAEAMQRAAASAGDGWIDEAVFVRVIAEGHRSVGEIVARAFALPCVDGAVTDGLPAYDRRAGCASVTNLVRYASALARQDRLAVGACEEDEAVAQLVQGRAVLGVEHALEARLVDAVRTRVLRLTEPAAWHAGDSSAP